MSIISGMEFDEQMELGHFVLTERKCRVCGKVKELIDGFYLIRKNKGLGVSRLVVHALFPQ